MRGYAHAGANWLLDAARGAIPGVNLRIKTGRNRTVETTTDPEDIWTGGGIYTGFPASGVAEALSIVSDSALDTGNGTGARTIRFTGLDANWREAQQTVTLTGTTPVVTTTLWQRVNFMTVLTAGSGGGNAGRISIKHATTTANVFVNADIGDNRSATAAWTIPADRTGWLAQVVGTSKTKLADIEMLVLTRPFGGVWMQLSNFTLTAEATNFVQNYTGGHELTPKTDIVIRAQSVTQSADVSASFSIVHFF